MRQTQDSDSLLFNGRKTPVTVGPWGTEVRYDRESRANSRPELCSDPVVRPATGVLCCEPFFACRVIGYKPLHATFEMEQQGLAAGMVGRMAITKILLQFICLTLQPWHMRGRESVNNNGHPCLLLWIQWWRKYSGPLQKSQLFMSSKNKRTEKQQCF